MAVKPKSVWYCSDCGHKQAKWAGQCPQCGAWNSLQEEMELAEAATKRFFSEAENKSRPMRITEVECKAERRIETKITEFDRLIGGGVVPGSLTLVGGDPGVGKSTLLLQLSHLLAGQGLTVLYVCGEESVEQTGMRAKRLGIETENLLLLSETNFDFIQTQTEAVAPDVLVIDSVQIVYKSALPSAPGSVAQVREVATECMHLAKKKRISTFLIGHVTKSGELAGPRVLEHLVDTVLYFEGDRQNHYRIIRAIKNRFGPTDEIAVFQMRPQGLAEVQNPSQMFLEARSPEMTGSAVVPTLEGSRTLLVEVQSLVGETAYATPTRRCSGTDLNRLSLLLAVLEKRMGYQLHRADIFVSIAGGLRILEPAADLAILLSVASSFRNRSLDPAAVVIGEVGLGGEVRAVARIESRLKEALQMGFSLAVIPRRNLKSVPKQLREKIRIVPVEFVEGAVDAVIT